MNYLPIELISGKAAHITLIDEQFLSRWSILFDKCKHATVFQHPSFVCTWYKTYHQHWHPVIIKSCNAEGNLTALWLLAYNPETRALVHAGAHQAEYHVWLALAGEDITFVTKAWTILKDHFDFTELHFKYLPSNLLSNILKSIPGIGNCLIVKKFERPLLNIDENVVKSVLSRQNRKRINQLKKIGNLEFRRITDPEEFEQVFNELISFHDFRMGAVNNILPFQKDQLKCQFYTSLLYAKKGAFFAGVSYLNNRPIAAELALICNETIHLNLGMHSPFLSMHSPGKIHIIQMCVYLIKENINLLDLTPGGDFWKEKFATIHDEVAHAVVYNSGFKKKQIELGNTIYENGKVLLTKIGIEPGKLKTSFLKMNKNFRTIAEIIKARKWSYFNRELRMYQCKKSDLLVMTNETYIRVNCNSIDDLLSYKPDLTSLTCGEFLSNANALIEKGAISYSICLNNCLAVCSWMLTNQTALDTTEVEQPISLPKGSAVFFNLYSHQELSNPDINKALIGHMLKEAFAQNETEYIYIFVQAKNVLMRQAIETMDFKYQESYSLRSTLN